MINESLMNLCKELENEVQKAYDEGVTLPEAEKLAARFLSAQMELTHSIRVADLDSRMRKSGVKAIRAAIYLDLVQKADKKPSDTLLEHSVNQNDLVNTQQEEYDQAEVDKDFLENYLRIAIEGHIFYRGIAKNQG